MIPVIVILALWCLMAYLAGMGAENHAPEGTIAQRQRADAAETREADLRAYLQHLETTVAELATDNLELTGGTSTDALTFAVDAATLYHFPTTPIPTELQGSTRQ